MWLEDMDDHHQIDSFFLMKKKNASILFNLIMKAIKQEELILPINIQVFTQLLQLKNYWIFQKLHLYSKMWIGS